MRGWCAPGVDESFKLFNVLPEVKHFHFALFIIRIVCLCDLKIVIESEGQREDG